ncbi:hypothetical protein AS030_19855 [Fictibacillus enclensis]|uniref:Uncharacterized protein n=2 Tax=Fictibacillus enclensis TaxID=1017270 RepID=A0A0V8J2L4_9BACL|nr:hypothetical protein AS030_19855 [Fictibacillus enclensis]
MSVFSVIQKEKGRIQMKFSSSKVNLGFLDLNKMGNNCLLSFGQTVRSRVYNTTKKNSAFGESNGDFPQHTGETYRTNDNDVIDSDAKNNHC